MNQHDESKDAPTSTSLRNQIADDLDEPGSGSPIKASQVGTTIIKLEQNADPGFGKGLGSTDPSHSQITSPITQPKIPALPGLNQALDSNLNSISNTFRKEVAERAGTSAQNTGREVEAKQLAMTEAVRASMSRKSGESHRDRLNTLNLDLDIPTSPIMQKG